MMNAIEFQTTITNSFVQIPNYEEFENKQVRIIVLDATATLPKQEHKNFISRYAKNPIAMDNDVDFFTRDEANERLCY